ncbi:hypothetical protein M8J77_011952 [Diaphorina citri]|nr:hypothetical protein M8J77_011952 [Diaphorina citri]
MKNLSIFDQKDTALPFHSVPIEQNENNNVKFLLLDNGKIFLYDNNHLYHYKDHKLECWYETHFKIDQIFSDELLNVFYIISDQHIRSISYENDTKCYDTDLWALQENIDVEPDDEIITAALSPDKEHLILLTKSCLVITLSTNFTLISQQDVLSTSERGEKESVNVGWGKVETQFHGSAKNAAQSSAAAEHVDTGPPSLVWCHDSQLFAVNYFNPEINSRMIKVFKVYGGECSLQYTSKPIAGLESLLLWRPHVMTHLVSTQRLPNKYVLIFIEKNTETKDVFELKNVDKVKGLHWNSDGTILAVLTEDRRVLMYTNSNWHWYLKQDLRFTSPLQLEWSSASQCSILHNSILHTYKWRWVVDAAQGVVSVIDGAEVLVTDFSQSFIPPPMCLERVQSPVTGQSVNRVLRFADSGDLLVVTAGGSVHRLNPQSETLTIMTTNSESRKMNVWNEESLVCVDNRGTLCAVDMKGQVENLFTPPSRIVSVDVKSSTELILQLENLDVLLYSRKFPTSPEPNTNALEANSQKSPMFAEPNTTALESNPSSHEVVFRLPELCTHLSYGAGHYLSLSANHKLYDNGELAASDVSSFVVHRDWLLLTTLTHRLVLYRLVPGRQIEEGHGLSRRLERGGTLVTVTPSCQVVLQMPRGNLETVTPRGLILDLLSDLLTRKQYGEAFVQMRKHRIDLNLLVDFYPPDYSMLVEQVQDPAWLSCFIADLKPDDVTKLDACYAEYYAKCANPRTSDPVATSVANAPKNIASICSSLRVALEGRDPTRYANTIMHCHVKSGNMAAALGIARGSSGALEFLILLHDVNALYEVALKLYDLDLALQIAAKSQKDPKEYVPYLNGLRSLQPYQMKAEIDKQFGSYVSAVRHFASSSDEAELEECLELIRKHKLWSQVLDVFPKSSSSYKKIVKEYAFQLELKGRWEEAAVMYERGEAVEEAVKCFVKAGAWRSALALAKTLNYGSEQMNTLYSELSRSLESKRDFTSLVTMLELRRDTSLTRDVIVRIVRDNQTLALDLSRLYEMEDLIESDIKPAITELHSELSDEIDTLERNFFAQLNRLEVVRSLPPPVVTGVRVGGDDELSDWGSDTASTMSTRSGFTGTSTSSRGRRKRKLERKLWSLREGNPREQISLVKALAETMQTLEKCTGRVQQLCESLVRLDLDSLAKDLQGKLKSSLGAVHKTRDLIWPPPEEHETSVEDARVNLPPISNLVQNWELECLKSV